VLEEIMMKKFIALVLVLAFAAPLLADDLVYAPFRGDPGSTRLVWTYDDPCGVYSWDAPESSSFVSDPPAGDPCGWGDPSFGMQVWGVSDPCNGDDWVSAYEGRNGVINFEVASWDLNNFVREPPSAKDMWVQVTYWNPADPGAAADIEYAGMGGPGDPCAPPTMGEWEGPIADWTGPEPEWSETWEDLVDPCDPCGPTEVWGGLWDQPLDEWDEAWPDPLYTWSGEMWFDAERVNSQVLQDGWIHDVFALTGEPNPEFEWYEMAYVNGVMVDQVVIETLCYVPEPATMVLLGLGSLLMIRRKR